MKWWNYPRHLRIAYGSAVETGDLLDLLQAANLVSRERCAGLIARNEATQKLLWGLLRKMDDHGGG